MFKTPAPPPIPTPQPAPAPVKSPAGADVAKAYQANQSKAAQMAGLSSTILTGGQGLATTATGQPKTLLGA